MSLTGEHAGVSGVGARHPVVTDVGDGSYRLAVVAGKSHATFPGVCDNSIIVLAANLELFTVLI